MNINQKLNTTNNFREENETMKNLTKNDYKNIESKVSGDLIFKDKNMLKMMKLLQNVVVKIFQLLKNVSLFK